MSGCVIYPLIIVMAVLTGFFPAEFSGYLLGGIVGICLVGFIDELAEL